MLFHGRQVINVYIQCRIRSTNLASLATAMSSAQIRPAHSRLPTPSHIASLPASVGSAEETIACAFVAARVGAASAASMGNAQPRVSLGVFRVCGALQAKTCYMLMIIYIYIYTE